MKIQVLRGTNHQLYYAEMLHTALSKIYDDCSLVHQITQPVDLAVFWAHRQTQIIHRQKNAGKDYLVVERAYIGDRFKWVSLGLNGLNGYADFKNDHITDMTRFNQHFSDYLKPYRKTDLNDPVLVIGQVMGDASHRHINIVTWYKNTIKHYNDMNIPVIFRPHPLDRASVLHHLSNLNFTLDTNEHLEDTFEQVRAVVTFNSNSGVLSVLAGLPTISCDRGSMVYNVTSHDLSVLDYTPNRDDWCAKIAYCQWLPEEIQDGSAFQLLNCSKNSSA